MFRTTLTLAIAFLAAFAPIQAQTYKNVSIVYDIEFDVDEMDAASASMLQGSTMTLRFLDQKVRLEMDMNIMTTTAINDEATGEGVVLMDMFGQKMYQVIDNDTEESPDQEFEIEYTGETMEIAGFDTEQAMVTYADCRSGEFWICKEIVPGSTENDFTLTGIKGMPLQMDMEQDDMTMHLVAIEVITDEPSADLFDTTPPAGYVEMDQ